MIRAARDTDLEAADHIASLAVAEYEAGFPDWIPILRHRILHVGSRYVAEEGGDPGLLFMCANADIERQFEFLQQSGSSG